MPRGGARIPGPGKKIGRPHNTSEAGGIGTGFATRVLGRIKELKLKDIESAEDYALDILRKRDMEARSFFRYMLDRQYGKPVQATITTDTREAQQPLERGDLPSHFPSAKNPSGSNKPN